MQKLLLLSLFSILFTANLSAKTIRYVKTDGTGDGSSWANASSNIQTMIDNSTAADDEVWVAKGTYFPTTETIARDARSRTFLVKVIIRGGFAGSETTLSQRQLADLDTNGKIDSCELVNKTILSGDIDGATDVWTKTTNADGTWKWTITGNNGNSYRVVTGEYGTTIDGFTVIGGNANNSTISSGGGIYFYHSFNITNCTVSNCSASEGGGIYFEGSYVSISNLTNCTVSNCSASNGGGIYTSDFDVTNCTVSNCSASNGGGIYSSFSYVTNCTVSNCSASNGGGIYTSDANLIQCCAVSNCSASYDGGGIYSSYNSSSSIFGGALFNNKTGSTIDGGGIYSSVTNCTISNCSAPNGGGIYSSFSYVTNCTVSNCSASNGGGIYTSDANLIQCCAVSNCSASYDGGGIYSSYNSSSSIFGGALFNNKTGSTIDGSTINFSRLSDIITFYTSPNISDAYIQPTSFIGVAITDVQKLELTKANWRLKEGSPCINYGGQVEPWVKDIDGNTRMLYGAIDFGAYEYVVPSTAIPVSENFNNLSDWNSSLVFYKAAQLNGLKNIKWNINSQKAVFSWQTNLTTSYSEPFFTYQVDATNSTNVYLHYDMYFEAYAGSISPLGSEELYVEYSYDLVDWFTIATYSNAKGTIANQTYKHDLSTQLAGRNFFIRFSANGQNTNRIEKWEIDNVVIDADGLSAVQQVQADKYKYLVTSGVLIISNLSSNTTIQLFDVNGKLLSNKVESQSANFILPAHGVYMVKVTSDSGIENKKIVW